MARFLQKIYFDIMRRGVYNVDISYILSAMVPEYKAAIKASLPRGREVHIGMALRIKRKTVANIGGKI